MVFRAPEGPVAHLISGLLAAPPDLRPPRGQARVLKPGQDPSLRINVARNSPSSISNVELTSLELQRFETFFKTDRVKLRATFVWLWLCRRPPASESSRVKPLSPLLARLCVGLKPPSPLLARTRVGLKPTSPLRAKRSCISCIFRLQWCRRFQRLLFRGEQWCRRFHAGLHQWLQRCYWFQSWHVAVSCARKSSPSARKMTQNWRFVACRASYFAKTPLEESCRAKFIAGEHKRPHAGLI